MKEPINDKQKLFFKLLVNRKGNVQQALDEMGDNTYNYQYAYKLMREYGDYLRDLITNKITLDAVRASYVVEQTMHEDGSNPAAKLNMEAALQILDRAGITKLERMKIETEGATNVFILPSKIETNDS